MVEATRHFTGNLNVRDLISTNRHLAGAVNQNIGTLQQRITQKAVGCQIAILELFLLILVGRYALQPTDRRHHRQEQMQLCVLGHL